jgi:Tol biopolymer transport system component/imidazolonepropionase-like amidohydrolase
MCRSVARFVLAALAVSTVSFPSAEAQQASPQAAPAAAPDKPAKWDVTQSLGPSSTTSFETSEGTWMNVDVSPDGRRIAFDLLGDLYVMPISGGQAKRITGGAMFDMQPRWSPDGTRIAFISDRDGLNNVWTMLPDGSDLRPVSKETSRDVNSPAWSPDGQYLFVRKHFVDQRSAGAGEVWMYHVSGGTGLQVTDRNGWQKDAGEPAISPDGKTLYYSKDVTPGTQFEYNKDPYAGIYAILRRDLETGEERILSGGAGGSITPAPSPDGKRLAFIRRVRLKTVLFTRDLVTGEERPLWDGLERDMQETWAIHGVYAQYDWLPDGSAVVIWAQGKLWRVDAVNGAARQIAFTAPVDQTVHDALRFRQDVAPARFAVKMLRDVTTSPDGNDVAYSALGNLWIKRLPDGAPRRVTADQGNEFNPQFSPDGRWLVYVSWTDAEQGRVRVVRGTGTDGREVVSTRGHYVEPAFSPDGKWIVYRSITADGIRGTSYGENPGIFVIPADGSAPPRRVTRNGTDPTFDPTGTRIYLRGFEDQKAILYSVNLTGGDRLVHFRSENATQIVPSPDGRWVAFAERYRAYVAAFPHPGRTVELGPSTSGYPVARISKDAGMYLHWSADSKRVHWSLGPDYFTRDLTHTFSFVRDGQEKSDEPETKGVAIGFDAPTDVPGGTVAFVGARIITSDAAGVIEDGTVVVEGNRIVAVGHADQVQVPAGADRVDVRGKTIMPGIVDVHAHVGGESSGLLAQSSWPLLANLAFGVTTSHDPSNDTETVFTTSEMIRAGRKLGPRLFSTGTILYGAEGSFKAIVETYEDALAHLRRMKAVGAFSVKSYNQRRRDARQMIIKAARELQMEVVPEGGSLVYTDITMVLDGHTGLEHSLPVPHVYQDVISLFAGPNRSGYTPTLIVGYGGLFGENYWYERTNVWENERLLAFTPRSVVDARSRRRVKAAGDDDFNHVDIARGAKAIRDAGGLVQLGAHGQLQGLGAHWELWMLVQGGMTPLQAVEAATLSGARYLGLEQDLGSIREGKLADLVVLDANPLEDIRNSEKISWVMVNGRLYDARTLAQAGNHSAPAPALYWK